MSRIIVKNLPDKISSDKLKETFSFKGRVTDVQLKYTPDGKFRKFAFIGYQSPAEASEAIEYYNNTFLNTSRIKVELCAELGATTKPKAWSKYAPDSSAYQALHKKEAGAEKESGSKKEGKKKKTKALDPDLLEKLEKYKNEPEFLEYLEAHDANSKLVLDSLNKESELDSNEEEVEEQTEGKDSKKEDTKSVAHAAISDLEYLKLKTKSSGGEKTLEKLNENAQAKVQDTFFTVKLKCLPYKTTKGNIKNMLKPLLPASIRLIPNVKGIAYVGFKTEKEMKQALIKNKTFLNGKQILISEYKSKAKQKDKLERWKSQEESVANEEEIAESGRIFLRNLAYIVNEDELREMFEKFGPVTEVIVPIDRETRQVKGYGVVTYLMPEHAVKAYTALDGTILHGRMLHLLPGKPPKEISEDAPGGSYKAEKLAKLKANSQSSHSWNTLFLGQDAVAEIIAERYNASKQEVLTGKDAAVRLALGETQIVTETKQFLEENGVKLDAFNQQVKKRSKTVILVKNLPAKTTTDEIRSIFAKYGELGRVLLPPSGITGIVEFLEPSEARNAFKKLAYSKFKYLPLYLEWAPENMFSVNSEGKKITERNEEDGEETEQNMSGEDVKENEGGENDSKPKESDDEDDSLEPEPDTTLFVKNLKFGTDEETLKKHFIKCGKIANITVARKKDPLHPGKLLTMGYGFVQFYSKSSVNEALKSLQGSELEGHKLELKRSNRTLQAESTSTRKSTNVKKQTGKKILIRNIPFQASPNEVRDLFKTFGELKYVRIPKKMVGTGPHRGFGFVEFVTKHDAKRAMKALCQSTHLFGRRLVLEWAENEEDNVEELRKRTAKHFFFDSKDEPTKKSKKATSDIMDKAKDHPENDFEDEELE